MRGNANRRSHENCEDDKERKRHEDAMPLPHVSIPFLAQFLLSEHRLDVVLMQSTRSFCGRTGQLAMTRQKRQSLSKDLRECLASLNLILGLLMRNAGG